MIIALLTASASAAVFAMHYGQATATVQTPDLALVAGSDSSRSCTVYPCTTVTVSNNYLATVAISLFPSVTNNPQAATYYTDLLQIDNSGTASHIINSIEISNVADPNSVLGSITIYYCSIQTNTPATSGNCVSFAITSTAGGTLSANTLIGAGAIGYFEAIGYASSTATASNSVTFQIGISWT